MNIQNDAFYMQRALELAKLAAGRTSPNPMVGAVIIKDGNIVGEGYHQRAGGAHAEINALHMAGAYAREATMYVTLEPCCHFGRTPPCTLALIEAGLGKIVVAMPDPNPLVSGQGIKMLESVGMNVQVGVLMEEAQFLNEIYCKYIQRQIPFVTLKTAMSLDGKIAAYTGDSRWVSGTAARRTVHQLRNTYDAVMVGLGTVMADDPMLNTRLDHGETRDPVRIIIDGELKLPVTSKIAQTSFRQTTYVICAHGQNQSRKEALTNLGIKILECGEDPASIPLTEALTELGSLEITSILLEGGAQLNAGMLEQKLVDKVHWFIAPKIVGGSGAPSPVGGQGAAEMGQALKLNDIKMETIGEDIMVTGYTGW